MKNAHQPAYPQSYESDAVKKAIIEKGGKVHGLSKRELFAAMAMQGLLSNGQFVQAIGHHNKDHTQVVTISIGIADELLKQLEA
jgi:hypothetical protein